MAGPRVTWLRRLLGIEPVSELYRVVGTCPTCGTEGAPVLGLVVADDSTLAGTCGICSHLMIWHNHPEWFVAFVADKTLAPTLAGEIEEWLG